MEQVIPLSSYRRSYERFKIDAQATLMVNKNSGIPSILTDLSPRGGGIMSNDPLRVNEKVRVIIRAPFFFADSVYREARVVWCKKLAGNLWQAGLDFDADNLIDFIHP